MFLNLGRWRGWPFHLVQPASTLKVICRTEESRPGGRGRKPGKPKKKGLLASLRNGLDPSIWWIFSMSGSLPAGVPRSLKPTRNVTCLAKKPIVRDPHILGLAAPRSHLSDPKVEHQSWRFPFYPGCQCKSWLACHGWWWHHKEVSHPARRHLARCVFTKGIFCVARCPTTKTYGVNAPPRDQFCVRMARLITNSGLH